MRVNKISMTVIGLVAVLMLLWQARANADVTSHYQAPVLQKAERALNNGYPNRAVNLLQAHINSSQRGDLQAEGYGLLCRAHLATGNYRPAEEACDTAIALGGNAGAWSDHNNRGLSRLLLDNFGEAIADLQRAVRMNPKDKTARHNLRVAERAQRTQSEE